MRQFTTLSLVICSLAGLPAMATEQLPNFVFILRDLNQRLTEYLLQARAQMPRPNPNYDPSKPTESRTAGKRKDRE